jgi:cytochrome d ubiquinol oxidase subunit II
VGPVWFCLVTSMLATYVVLDGYDLGAGILHLQVARSDRERRIVLRSIGPLWDGNEVWLIASGGTLFFAFPALYSASFSGFYLPLMIVLWLLILRGVAVDLRDHFGGPLWPAFFDLGFAVASTLLTLFYGVALGNLVRGVELDENGYFFLPLWTNFRLGEPIGILDWYTLLVGLAAFAALALQGALWINLRSQGAMQERAQGLGRRAWWAVLVLTILVTLATLHVQPIVLAGLQARPWGLAFPTAALAGLCGARICLAHRREGLALAASSLYLVGMLASVAVGLYPYVLPATDPALSLTVDNACAGQHGLAVGLVWWSLGIAVALAYSAFAHWRFAGKVVIEEND